MLDCGNESSVMGIMENGQWIVDNGHWEILRLLELMMLVRSFSSSTTSFKINLQLRMDNGQQLKKYFSLSIIPSQFSIERTVQQRLLQRVQRGKLLLAEGFEALGFFVKGVELGCDFFLFLQRGKRN